MPKRSRTQQSQQYGNCVRCGEEIKAKSILNGLCAECLKKEGNYDCICCVKKAATCKCPDVAWCEECGLCPDHCTCEMDERGNYRPRLFKET